MGQWFGWADDDHTRPNKLPEIAAGSPEAVELHKHFQKRDIVARFAVHKVVEGIKVVRRHILDGKKYRALQVSPLCKHFIEELTIGYQYPPEGTKRDDEKPLDGNDHACDAFRYWAWLRARR
jgi:phage terminase large subunit